ncbi:3-dehydroquinate synthase [Pleionea sp. CnH1-48]|uniref:3-dehydroquinate synthase n=1 Tax=Pleionea sp. CnH1-48 TaxID=2954494 RepID=UPI002097DE23|nr:3-dehydroquinate synthase [Pleionea sp. CnH1-48]MCO7224474.1 3-dehydroquinate synthase [Pleionea sp. CnH1-48]
MPIEGLKQVTVHTEDCHYPIFIGSDLFDSELSLSSYIVSPQVLLVSNETVAPLYLEHVKNLIDGDVSVYLMPDGEEHKSFATFSSLMDSLIEGNFRRNATLIALGGGVVGDMTGFVAACYQRGVPFIQVPTSLLAMVDSSVGGKTAINHPQAKNMVGAFYQPQAVFIELNFLDSLPPREYRAGLAEVVKYGLIDDFSLFTYIEDNITAINARDKQVLATLVERCCQIKAKVVGLDEKESGIRAILNLGHTFGHAIEKVGRYKDYVHGEAVAIGTCMAFDLAVKLGQIDSGYALRVEKLFESLGLATHVEVEYDAEEIMRAMQLDKKNLSERIRLILPAAEGRVEIVDTVDIEKIKSVVINKLKE